MHASREGTGVPREKHKTWSEEKKAAHTLSKSGTAREEVRQCHSVRLIPLAQKEKDEAYILWCVSSLMLILSLFICFKHEVTL